MSLYDELAKIGQQVKSQLPQMKTSERATIQVSVLPLIGALGYNTQDLSEVYPEYAILNMDAVDYAVLRNDVPDMFVEAKSAGNKLQNKEWKQLFQYFNAEIGLRFGILTNGVEYRFYTDLKAENIMDKEPFLVIDMLNLDERLVAELEGLTKSGFDPERVVDGARKRVLARLLNQEMNNPSDEIARYFAKQVHSGRLTEANVQRYRRLLQDAWRELTPPKPVVNPPPPRGGFEHKGDPDFIPVYGNYEGHKFKAELLRESIKSGLTIAGHQIRYDGKTTWLKNAAVMAIRSVEPSFEPTKTFPNGFQFWHVVDPESGKEHMIRSISGWDMTDEALRERVLSS